MSNLEEKEKILQIKFNTKILKDKLKKVGSAVKDSAKKIPKPKIKKPKLKKKKKKPEIDNSASINKLLAKIEEQEQRIRNLEAVESGSTDPDKF